MDSHLGSVQSTLDFANWSTDHKLRLKRSDDDDFGSGHGSGDWDGSGSGDWDTVALDSPIIGMEPVATTMATTTTAEPIIVLGVEMCLTFSGIPGVFLSLFEKRGEYRKAMKANICGPLEEAGAFCNVDSMDNCPEPPAIFNSDGSMSADPSASYCFSICVDIEMAEQQVIYFSYTHANT